MNKLVYYLSNLSNVLPVIAFLFVYKKTKDPFNIIFLILILGFLNDLIYYVVYSYYNSFHIYLKISDVYQIVCLGLWLYFFYSLKSKSNKKIHIAAFIIGILFMVFDWAYLSKFNRNGLLGVMYINVVYIYLCLNQIGFQIANGRYSFSRFDPILIYCLAMCIFFSYHIFIVSIYFLEIPLHIKLSPTLYYVVPILNVFTNIIYTISIPFFPKKGILSNNK
jgi:hypothetical protein